MLKVDTGKLKNLRAEVTAEILNLMEAIREQERLRRWDRYVPLPHQERFHRSPARMRAIIGSNRCGKTVAGMKEALWYMRGEHPFRPEVLAPNRGWVVALDNEVTRDVLFPRFLSMLRPGEAKRVDGRGLSIELANGSLAKFKSCDSGRTKFQSAENRWTWFDEEPPKDIYDECAIRIGTDDPLDMWLTMTPLMGMDWSYDEIYHNQSPGETEVFEAVMDDNTHLPEKERARMRNIYKDSEEASARLEGRYFSRSGLIYKQFSLKDHVCDPFPVPQAWPHVLALDPHTRKPSAAVWCAVAPDGCYYVVKELNETKEELLEDFADKVVAMSLGMKVVRKLIDPSSVATNNQTNRSARDVLSGKHLGTILANNDVNYGWDQVRTRLSSGSGVKLRFFRTCPKTIWQMEHLAYEEWRFRGSVRDPKETQRKKNDDLADCVRYICASRITGDPPQRALESEAPFTEEGLGRYTGYR